MLLRTDSTHPGFHELIGKLDEYLAGINGEKNSFFQKLNHVPEIRNVVLLFSGDQVIACGAFKASDASSVEMKRMFVLPEHRRAGHAQTVLKELENWAQELGYQRAILETARTMTAAVMCYKNWGYREIPNFGPYVEVETSICFERRFE